MDGGCQQGGISFTAQCRDKGRAKSRLVTPEESEGVTVIRSFRKHIIHTGTGTD